MTSKPVQRLDQVVSHLQPLQQAPPAPPHSARFRPSLPPNLPINFTPLNPISFLLKAAQIRPDHVAISHPARNLTYTYREWALRVKDLAYALKSRGLQRGDRVLTLLPNLPAHSDALQAIPAAQMVIVPINTRLSATDVDYIIQDSGSKLLLVDSELVHLLPKDLKGRGVQVVVCADRDHDEYEKFLEEGREYDRRNGGKEWSGLEFIEDENATFAISYTSGTTSRPKGVETTYRSTYLAAVANAHEARLDDESVFLWTLPMFHCCGWCYPYATTLAMCTSVCLRGVGDYSEVWKGLLERGVTHYCAAPTVQISIVNHPLARPVDHPVRTVIAGAAPTATLIASLEKIGISVVHVWGMTETLGPLTRTYYVGSRDSPDYYRNMARQGFAFLTSDDIRIVKLPPDGSEEDLDAPLVEVEPNGMEVGEIVTRGNITMKGYWNKPEATRKAFAGGWLHTGDLAVRFPNGTFAITDRSKDMIISGGENISSLSVENALSSHEAVHEVAVVAKKHEKWGERPHAFIVLKPALAQQWQDKLHHLEQELKTFLRGKIPPFAIPDSLTHMTQAAFEKTKTATGKVQKKELRELANK
ncbi:uncharacterized protein JCM6883_002582 [Sporobolomyces salmoneus]|uniref:uncharacterized protein n=1 Tax=Sporobolomyces salmoneus TaxID=183962 RepID=UPI003177BE65